MRISESLHAVAATSARWRAVDHAMRAGNEPGREGVARDDPNNLAYDAFLKYATLKFACVDVLDPAKATSVASLAFSHDDALLATAVSYTHEAGEPAEAPPPDQIFVRTPSEQDVRARGAHRA